MSAPRLPIAAPAHAACAAYGVCRRLRRAGVRLQHRPADYRRSGCAERLSLAPSDLDHGEGSHAAALHRRQSRQLDAGAARRGAGVRADLEEIGDWRRHHRSAGRQQQRALFCRLAARDRIDSGRDRRAAAQHRGAQLSGFGAGAGDGAHQLSADRRPSRAMRHMAEGHRAEPQSRLFRKSAELELRLLHAAQSRGDGRGSGRSGAAARRDADLRAAAYRRDGEIPAGAADCDVIGKNVTPSVGKITDLGQ